MGQSPDTHLFYGYVWDGETSLSSILHPDRDWDEDSDDSDDWQDVLLKRRGIVSPYSDAPDRAALIEMGRNATDEQYNDALRSGQMHGVRASRSYNDDYVNENVGWHIYSSTAEYQEKKSAWYAAKKALDDEFSCDLGSYGGGDVHTAYLYVKQKDEYERFKSSWDGPTRVHTSELHFADYEQMDVCLQEFIEALDLPMGKPEYGKAPVGPGWFMVTSYG